MTSKYFKICSFLFLFIINSHAQNSTSVWNPDNGDGTYNNPIIYADYSDPDVIRVGEDYYMTSSSFSNIPGLPILHSKDLVNWKIIGHAVNNYPIEKFNSPQHGGGIWAPSLRFHNNEFYIYFGDPDHGIFMTKAKYPQEPWEPLHLVREAKGWIDPCPLWDDDGNVYLVHAWAKSRSGIKHKLTINKLNKEGTKILDEGVDVFCDSINHPTLEGPKFYKRNGYYYIFAPAGGVKPGWQNVLRSKNIYGPYEIKKVLEQGSTIINGPHQGGWVQTPSGEDWFVHFQDRYAYGRIVHLQPMKWEGDWPVMGTDYDKNGIGEPILNFRKPITQASLNLYSPQTSDDFDGSAIGLQWQWNANFNNDWFSLNNDNGKLRLYSQAISTKSKNLWRFPAIVTQKFPVSKFSAVAKISFNPETNDEKFGFIIFGIDYSYISIEKKMDVLKIAQYICRNADKDSPEEFIGSVDVTSQIIYLRVDVYPENEIDVIPKVKCVFSFSLDGNKFEKIGDIFIAREGKWVGAKIGFFALKPASAQISGFTDVDWIKFENKND